MIRKLAFDPVTIGSSLAVGHLARNTLVSLADKHDSRGKPGGSKFGKSVHAYKVHGFRTGVLHGLDQNRSTKSVASLAVESTPVLGSDHFVHHYRMGYELGAKIKHESYAGKRAHLNKIHKLVTNSDGWRDIPRAAAVGDGIKKVLSNKSYGKWNVPSLGAKTLQAQKERDISDAVSRLTTSSRFQKAKHRYKDMSRIVNPKIFKAVDTTATLTDVDKFLSRAQQKRLPKLVQKAFGKLAPVAAKAAKFTHADVAAKSVADKVRGEVVRTAATTAILGNPTKSQSAKLHAIKTLVTPRIQDHIDNVKATRAAFASHKDGGIKSSHRKVEHINKYLKTLDHD